MDAKYDNHNDQEAVKLDGKDVLKIIIYWGLILPLSQILWRHFYALFVRARVVNLVNQDSDPQEQGVRIGKVSTG